MNKIISQYILREIFTTWLGVTLILLIVLITNKFAGVISDIASGDILSSSLLPIIALSSIEYLVILLPLSTFLSVIIVIGRFYRDHEMTAIQVAGKGTGFIYRIFLFPLIILIGLLAFISIVISPNAKESILLNEEAAIRSVGIEFFEPGRFVNLK
ncbi:MAG TPA: LptF/LptG family permease, partial [Gammaproteobacteria bacterium]|nr:LptF/LptG family permease [Gammaproteobacteria bacterium]